MRIFPNLLSSYTCNNGEFILDSVVNCDGLILTVCYNNANLYFSLQDKIKF